MKLSLIHFVLLGAVLAGPLADLTDRQASQPAISVDSGLNVVRYDYIRRVKTLYNTTD